MLQFARVDIGDGGVATCRRCSAAAAKPWDGARVADAIRNAGMAGVDGIRMDGFEPFSHPALPAIVTEAATVSSRVAIVTDAGALSVGANVEGILDAGVRHFVIVLNGPDAATHDGLTGREGLFEAARAGVGALRARAAATGAQIAVSGRIRVCRHVAPTAAATSAMLAGWGAIAVEVEAASGFVVDRRLAASIMTATTMGGCCAFGPALPHGFDPWSAGELS